MQVHLCMSHFLGVVGDINRVGVGFPCLREFRTLEKTVDMAWTTPLISSGVPGEGASPKLARALDTSFIQDVYSGVSGLR